MSEITGSPIPYREDSFREALNKKAAVMVPFYANRIVKWLIEMVSNVIRFVLDLIPEALGKDQRRRRW